MSDFDLAVRRWREQAMHNAMRRMPPALCSKIGSYMGANVGPKIDPGGDRAVRAVVRLVRPDLEGAAHEAAVHRIWANIGRVFAEFSVLPKLLGRTELVGEDIAREVFSDPRPLIVVYPHLANWEVLGALLCIHPAARDRRKCAIYAPQDDPVRAAIAEQCRAQFPADLIPQGPRIWKQFRERLHEPRGSVFAPVDGTDPVGRRFPLFGRAPDHRGAVGKLIRVAAASGARLLPTYCSRKPGARFTVTVMPPIDVPHGRLGPADTEAQIVRLNEIFEPLVRAGLDDWYMAVEAEVG